MNKCKWHKPQIIKGEMNGNNEHHRNGSKY
jgi:hypothetical protein